MQACRLKTRSFRDPEPIKNGVFHLKKCTSDYFGCSEESLHSLTTILESSVHVGLNSENKNQQFGKCSDKKDVTFGKVTETQLENPRGACKGSKISKKDVTFGKVTETQLEWFGASSKVRHFLYFSFGKSLF